jgi:hypothetical protein
MLTPNILHFLLVASAVNLVSTLHAQVAWNEALNGDFSNSGLTPTFVTLGPGSNNIFGVTGNPGSGALGSGTDRDYLTITVPVGLQLTSLSVLPGTVAGGLSFLGLQSGNKVTLPTNAASAAGLLGWTHYSTADAGSDVFARMGIAANGSSGFTAPLGAGDYSFWIQDFNAGAFNYGFQFVVIPEPTAIALALAGLSSLVAGFFRRHSTG